MQANVGTTSITFGAALDNLYNNIHAIKGNEINEITIAQEIELLIENTKEAYKSSSKEVMEKLNSKARTFFEQLSELINDFERDQAEQKSGFKERIQGMAKTLPLSTSQNRVDGMKPNLLSIGDVVKSSLVMIQGYFPAYQMKGFEPSLTLEGKKCTLFNATQQALTFEVPNSTFVKKEDEQYAVASGILLAPWNSSYLPSVKSYKEEAQYRINVTAVIPEENQAEMPKEMSLAVADMPQAVQSDLATLEKLIAGLQKYAHISNLPAEIKMYVKSQPASSTNAVSDSPVSPTSVETVATTKPSTVTVIDDSSSQTVVDQSSESQENVEVNSAHV